MTLNNVNSRHFWQFSSVRSAIARLIDWIFAAVQRLPTPIKIMVFGAGVWLNRYIESPSSLIVDQVIVILLTAAVLALSVVSKRKRFKGSGSRWLVGIANSVEWVFWGLGGAMFDAMLTLLAIANQLPVESVATIVVVSLLYMGLTVRILKRAQNSLSPTPPGNINPV